MMTLAIVLYFAVCLLVILGLCNSAAQCVPRQNRRGGRLGKWLKFHGSIR